MLFKGRLRLPSDAGEGIPIDLAIEDVFLSLESEGEDFGEWRLDTVQIKRLFSNQFSLLLDGEEMVFIADDALGFAYEGLAAVEDVQGRLSKRRIFRGRKAPKKKTVVETASGTDEAESTDEPVAAETRPDVPMPEVVPFFPEAAPTFEDSVAESAVVDESIAPIAPRPIEIAETSPAPAPSPPPPEPAVEPVPVESPVAADLPVEDQAAEPEPVTAETDVDDLEPDDEYEIEDVSAFGYVPVATAHLDESREPQSPTEVVEAEVEPPDADDELEIEDATAGAGAVLREVHPLGDPAPADIAPDAGTAPVAETLDEPEPEPVAEAAPPAPAPEPEMPAAEAEPTGIRYDPVPLPPDPQPSFAQWSSNGAAVAEPEPTLNAASDELENDRATARTQKSGRHARTSSKSKSSLFGRKKSREPEEHEHRYESSKTVGGITRRICAICGHVSFAGEDVYQNW